jgi:hypothetical protein
MNAAVSESCSFALRRCFVRWINETGLRIVKSRGNLRGGEPHFFSVLRFGGLVLMGDLLGMGEVCERDIVVNQGVLLILCNFTLHGYYLNDVLIASAIAGGEQRIFRGGKKHC